MERQRASFRLSSTAKDLRTQIAATLGLSLTGTVEVVIREKAIS